MGPFQTKQDHLEAWGAAYLRLEKAKQDYEAGESGFTRYSRELREVLEDMKALCDTTLSDPDYAEPKPF